MDLVPVHQAPPAGRTDRGLTQAPGCFLACTAAWAAAILARFASRRATSSGAGRSLNVLPQHRVVAHLEDPAHGQRYGDAEREEQGAGDERARGLRPGAHEARDAGGRGALAGSTTAIT